MRPDPRRSITLKSGICPHCNTVRREILWLFGVYVSNSVVLFMPCYVHVVYTASWKGPKCDPSSHRFSATRSSNLALRFCLPQSHYSSTVMLWAGYPHRRCLLRFGESQQQRLFYLRIVGLRLVASRREALCIIRSRDSQCLWAVHMSIAMRSCFSLRQQICSTHTSRSVISRII